MTKEKGVAWTEKVGLFVAIVSLLLAYAGFKTSSDQFKAQTEIARKTEIAQNQPMLHMEMFKADTNDKYGLWLRNLGNGSAVIEHFHFYEDREAFEKGLARQSWLNAENIFWFGTSFVYEEINMLVPGYALTANERSDVFLLSTKALNQKQIDRLKTDEERVDEKELRASFYNSLDRKALEKVIIEIKYKSISPLDDSTYTLLFSESFMQNNMRDTQSSKSNIEYEPGF